MKHFNQYLMPARFSQRQRGFSLIELMVSLTIATLLMLGLVEIFSSARASYNLQEGLARMQENSRYASGFINRTVRETGYFPIAEVLNPLTNLGFNVDTTIIPPPIDLAESVDGGGNNSDTLSVSAFTDRDCFGQLNPVLDPRGLPAFFQKQTVFTQAGNQLIYTCRYGVPGGAPVVQILNQPLVDGIEAFQVQYGVDTDVALDESANGYTDAPTGVPQLVSLRIGMIVSSADIFATTPDAQDIQMMGQLYPAPGDLRIRRAVVNTISLRNFTP
ncbi:MAG: hypothetical protein Tsb002_23820 [Wenzhouxiangellaceae bacterium]